MQTPRERCLCTCAQAQCGPHMCTKVQLAQQCACCTCVNNAKNNDLFDDFWHNFPLQNISIETRLSPSHLCRRTRIDLAELAPTPQRARRRTIGTETRGKMPGTKYMRTRPLAKEKPFYDFKIKEIANSTFIPTN